MKNLFPVWGCALQNRKLPITANILGDTCLGAIKENELHSSGFRGNLVQYRPKYGRLEHQPDEAYQSPGP